MGLSIALGTFVAVAEQRVQRNSKKNEFVACACLGSAVSPTVRLSDLGRLLRVCWKDLVEVRWVTAERTLGSQLTVDNDCKMAWVKRANQLARLLFGITPSRTVSSIGATIGANCHM